jgi:hypothetical protein
MIGKVSLGREKGVDERQGRRRPFPPFISLTVEKVVVWLVLGPVFVVEDLGVVEREKK